MDKAIQAELADGLRAGEAQSPAARAAREWLYRFGAVLGLLGRRKRPFQLLKFRSMWNRVGGPVITAASDPRITGTGRILGKFKLVTVRYSSEPGGFDALAIRKHLTEDFWGTNR